MQMSTDNTVVIAQPANFKQRFLATCIDEILLGITMLIVFLPPFAMLGQSFLSGEGLGRAPDPPLLWAGMIIFAIFYPFPYFYSAMFEASRLSATPGKLLFGLKVVSERNERITLSEGLIKASLQTIVYTPIVVFCFVLIVLFISIMGVAIDKKFVAIIGLILNIIFPLFATAALSYPCFRNGSQSFVDLMCHRFVVRRNAQQEYAQQPLEKFESAIHWLNHLSTGIFWVLAVLLVLSMQSLLFLHFSSMIPDAMIGLCLLVLCLLTSLWFIWQYRRTVHNLIANVVAVLMTICLVVSTISCLPETTSRLSNTPRALALFEKALVANKSGDKKNYEKLRAEAKSKPSYALGYYVMHHGIRKDLLGLPDDANYYAPRFWAIHSGPGVPPKETKL
jgi:uncharacterized RDD family membrane protein YckC